MDPGLRRFPIKLEDSSGPEDSSETEDSGSEEICNARSTAALRGPLPHQHPELDGCVARWNAIVAGREQHPGSMVTLKDPELRLEFVRCFQRRESDLAASEDEEYTPATEIWSEIATHFNDIVGLPVFEGWESARRTAVSICAPRYHMLARGRLPAPSGNLGEAIDRWNEGLRRRKRSIALELAESVLWPTFQEKIRAVVHEEEAAVRKVNINAMPRSVEERDGLIALLDQNLRDDIKAEREAAVRSHIGSTTSQTFTPMRKRGTGEHEQTPSSKRRKGIGYGGTGDANGRSLSLKQTKGRRGGGSEWAEANTFSSGKHNSAMKSQVKLITAGPKKYTR